MAKLYGNNAEEPAIKAVKVLEPQAHWLHSITGDNENSNGLIRHYFPKATSPQTITNKVIEYVQHK